MITRKIILSIGIVLLISVFSSCADGTSRARVPVGDDFVRVENNVFMVGQDTFRLMMLNYLVSYRNFDGEFVVSPSIKYEEENSYEFDTKHETEAQLSRHFKLISEMGFNAVRLCCDRMTDDDHGHYFYRCDSGHFSIVKDSTMILNAFDKVLKAAEENGLRIMILLRPPFDGELEEFASALMRRFADNPTMMAYDMMNEPLYFDPIDKRGKKSALKAVRKWEKLVRQNAPKTLFTIGFAEPIEVFEWDPSVMPVDFVEMHTYHPLRVANEMYWYGKYVGKPWIVGETSLPADDDSITYKEQARFLVESYQRAMDCGAAGYGWWEFQDIDEGNYEAKYSGLLNHKGFVLVDGDTVYGSLKDAAFLIKDMKHYKKQEANMMNNYYNMLGYNNIVIKGKILDHKTKQPIEGAVVRAWNKYWNVGLNTFTDSEGNFSIYSNDKCVHFEVSAPGKTKLKFNRKIKNYVQLDPNADWDNLPNRKLEYHSISYHPFLSEEAETLFDVDASLFNSAKFVGNMGTLYLKDL